MQHKVVYHVHLSNYIRVTFIITVSDDVQKTKDFLDGFEVCLHFSVFVYC